MPDDARSIETVDQGPAVDETIINLLRMVYVTEIYGAEAFGYMLETYQGLTADHRRKLEACRRLELTMGGMILDHLTLDLGLSMRPPQRARRAAESLATQQHDTWDDRMGDLERGAIRGVAALRALKAMYGDREPRFCAVLLAHEMALRDFARDEQDQEPDFSIDPILALISPEDRQAIALFQG